MTSLIVCKLKMARIYSLSICLMGFLVLGNTGSVMGVDFAKVVLPILSNKCFECHGPDTKKKEDLRLDSFEAATLDLGGYKAIDPKNPEKSEALIRIFDKKDPMPPEDAAKQLTEREKEIIKEWVLSGGEYAKHWAFELPKKSLPKNAEKGENPIDVFVKDKLNQKGFQLAPEADKSVLARRASLVLTGLPPEVDILDKYLEDKSENAYEDFVDSLLSDPRFGEHQARYWLDAVRYGDTHGLHLDNRRGIYPYRDWIVRSLNQNLPFNESIKWQLAGDLLPEPTTEQLLATGYVRMNPTTSEGGVIPAEFQAKNNFDRTETLGTVFLGMTLSCARCHSHKYDPISQKEYYELFAFFNSTAENSLDGNSYTYGPNIRVPNSQVEWNRWNYLKDVTHKLVEKAEKVPGFDKEALLNHAQETLAPKFSEWYLSDPVKTGSGLPGETPEWKPIKKGLPGSIRDSLPAMGQSRWVKFSVEVSSDRTIWLQISGNSDSKAYIGEQEFHGPKRDDQLKTVLALPVKSGTNEIQLELTGGNMSNSVSVQFLDPYKKLKSEKNWDDISTKEKLQILDSEDSPIELGALKNELSSAVQDFLATEANFTTTLIARELTNPRKTFVLRRGEYNQPQGDPVQPGVLGVMGQLEDDLPRNRLGLAHWLTSAKHPTVSRVIVNQLWSRIFGDGLVRTPEDFGLQGQQPTHPELLDYLAVDFVENGWNIKQMLKLMVTSRTFKQSSSIEPDRNDPENLLWSRGPSYRLDAEVIRDIALWSSGALNDYMGGEGVKPYQPEGMWFALAHPASNTKRYVADQSDRLYRRSLYVYWKRTSPHPMMTLFDAPSRESSCLGRSRTNTPLQSLGLLNETQRVELGRVYAEKLLISDLNDRAKINKIFKQLTSRSASEKETRICLNLLAQMKDRYKADPESAKKLISVGLYPTLGNVDPEEHAAWTQVVITVLASDLSILLY